MDDIGRAGSFNKSFGKHGVIAEFTTSPAHRKPYTRKHKLHGDMGYMFTNPKLEYATVEISGKGCSQLSGRDVFEMVAEKALDSVTRFDVAIDFDVPTTPTAFVLAGISDRIKSKSFVQSPDGETVYIGSPKSDMMCRVYKYNEPHERAGLLRIELVARRNKAKLALRYWLEHGPIFAVAFMAKAFEFKHHLWQSGAWQKAVVDREPQRIRSVSKTQKWLLKQVKPALLKLAANDELEPAFLSSFLEGVPHVSVDYQQGDQTVRDTTRLPLDGEGEQPFDSLLH
jgi:DNA relaxase NicK